MPDFEQEPSGNDNWLANAEPQTLNQSNISRTSFTQQDLYSARQNLGILKAKLNSTRNTKMTHNTSAYQNSSQIISARSGVNQSNTYRKVFKPMINITDASVNQSTLSLAQTGLSPINQVLSRDIQQMYVPKQGLTLPKQIKKTRNISCVVDTQETTKDILQQLSETPQISVID